MRELGERLRRAREAKGLTLEDLTNRTKIGARYLEALEKGDFGAIPGHTYLRGFLQNYSAAVGLDPTAILGELDALAETGDTKAGMDGVYRPSQEARSVVGQPRSIAWWRPALAIGALISAAIFILIIRGGERSRSGSGPGEKASILDRAASGETEPKSAPAVPVKSDREATVLTLRYSARCWVRIFCDGKQVFEGTMSGGTVQEWSARREIQVMLGNAGGVRGELNGQELPPFGATGISVTRVFKTEEGD